MVPRRASQKSSFGGVPKMVFSNFFPCRGQFTMLRGTKLASQHHLSANNCNHSTVEIQEFSALPLLPQTDVLHLVHLGWEQKEQAMKNSTQHLQGDLLRSTFAS